ncbi:TadE/TadG family type IV pilus assembly protein [Lachnospiraceae bacterium 54-53]
MLKKKIWSGWGEEGGQSVLEFALVLPILVLLLMIPLDFFIYMNTQMTLSSAASECISRLDYPSVSSGTGGTTVMEVLVQDFSERLDPGMVTIEELNAGSSQKTDYTYYVYSSDLADPSDFAGQFESRPASYRFAQLNLQLSYERTAVTFWGALFLGNTYEVKTPVYSRNVYINGYTPG